MEAQLASPALRRKTGKHFWFFDWLTPALSRFVISLPLSRGFLLSPRSSDSLLHVTRPLPSPRHHETLAGCPESPAAYTDHDAVLRR